MNGPIPSRGPVRRQQRSELTRKRLIDATIACLVKLGYAHTNTLRVASEAGLTRGAVLHHFRDGPDLIRATIVELHEKRLRALGRIAKIDASQTGAIMHLYWQQLSSPAAIAFEEIRVAARTDEALAAVLQPLDREYQHRWDVRAVNIFADWQKDPESFELAITLAQTVLEGLAARRRAGIVSDRAVELMLSYLERRIGELRPSAVPAE